MVKMKHAPSSKLVSIDKTSNINYTSNICPNNVIKPTLSEVLQSDSVKWLFNQPNFVIKVIPSKLSESDKNMFWHKKNGVNTTLNCTRPSEISIPVRTADEEKEDANLLPSKIEHKKSEITLLPVKKKSCGHYEPCENIVCDVIVQQYMDKDGVSPMVALNIEEDEINAPVEKHCENEYCDALSIDHNRCRQALIKLHRCDRSHICDICGITFKKWISRIYHKNCTRKKEYVHNNVDRLHLQKERMRMRELQILEISRMKKHDYSDPARAMEKLRRNEELIILPQKASSQRPIVIATSVPSTQLTSSNLINAQPIKITSAITTATIFRSVPITVSSQNTMICGNTSHSESKVKSISQIRFPNLQQNSHLRSTSIAAPIKAQTQVSTSTSAPVPALAPALIPAPVLAPAPITTTTSVPTLTLALAPVSTLASTSASTSASVSIPAPVPTLALAPNSASASVPASIPTLTLALTPTSAPAVTSTSTPALVTTSAPTVVSSHKQYIRLAVSPQIQPTTINNWIVSPSQILTTTQVQPKTFLTPIRVVPITNLISPPSLLHHTQGIPKFCIVAENLIKPVTIPKSSSVQPASAAANTIPTQVNASNLLVHNPTSKVRKTPKLMKAKKNFFCVYCSKNITTDWYFKMHIAKHKGEKLFFCNFCDESFSNNYDMKKHVTNQHTNQKELACDKCNYTCTSLASFKSHVQTHALCSLDKADVQLKNQRKHPKELSKDKMSRKIIHETYKRKIKRIKCEDASDSQNECVEKHNKELLTINVGNAKAKRFNFVSVKEIVEPENFEQESAITSR